MSDRGAPDAATDALAAAPPPCPEAVPRLNQGTTVITLDVRLRFASAPLIFGEPNRLPSGGMLMPINLRFYVSTPVALSGNGRIPVNVVDADGNLARYGVHLVNAAEDGTMKVRLAIPPGSYTGLAFVVGLTDQCNSPDPAEPARRKPPLTAASQMTWPQPFGYLFLRYEGQAKGTTEPGTSLAAVHMGGVAGVAPAPEVAAAGAFEVTSQPATLGLELAVDRLLELASRPAAPTSFPVPGGNEAVAGESLRQNVRALPIFTLAR